MGYLPNILLSSIQTNIIMSVLVVVLLGCSSFFSASETAFSTVNNLRMRNYADEKVRGARKAVYICENYSKTLATILVGNNLVNIACTTICAYLFSELIANPTLANILNTVVMTIIVLIFGEIMPKAIAKQNSEKVALRFAGVLYVIIKVLTPITFVFIKLQNALVKGKKELEPTVTEDELESIIDTMEDEGVIDSDDAELIQGVLDLNEKCAYDVMTPRVNVTGVSIDAGVDEVKNIFLETQYSRLPVYNKTIDEVVGVLSQKDFFAALINGKKIDIKKMMQQPLFISEIVKVNDIIREMQQTKNHIAIVLDEYGGTSGIVTMEDAIEEIVGEIYDEHDDEEVQENIKQLEPNKYLVDGEVEIEDLFEKLEIEHLPESQYTNVAGLLYERSADLPEKDQEIEMDVVDDVLNSDGEYVTRRVKLNFKLVIVEDNRVKQTVVTLTPLDEIQDENKEKRD